MKFGGAHFLWVGRARRLFQLCVLGVACSAMSCPEGEDLLAKMAYTQLTPPSNLFVVGAVVAVEDDGDNDVNTAKFKLCCGPRASMGEHWTPLSSETVAQSFQKTQTKKWKLGADLLARVRVTADVEGVENIEATLTNARLMQISDADVLENLANRSPECRHAIRQRLAAGHTLTMIASAIVADMQYKVTFKQSANVDAKARIREMQKIAASLGGGQQRIGQRTIESRGLALGIRTDAFLLALSVPDLKDNGSEIITQHNKEIVSPHQRASTDSSPDAPLVPPHGQGLVTPVYSLDD